MFPDSATVFDLELAAGTITMVQLRYILLGRPNTIFVDNKAVLGALVKGASSVPDARRFISTFWPVASDFSI